jgi:hypothetical protein
VIRGLTARAEVGGSSVGGGHAGGMTSLGRL